MKLKDKNQDFISRHATLITPLVIALLSYVGIDVYPKIQEQINGGGGVNVEIHQAPPPAVIHTQAPAAGLTKAQVQAMIDKAIGTHQGKRYHEFD